MQSLQRLLSDFRSRPKRHLGLAFLAVANQLSIAVLAASPTVLAVPALNATQSACSIEGCLNPIAVEDDSHLVLPAGSQQCRDSGPAAACAGGADKSTNPRVRNRTATRIAFETRMLTVGLRSKRPAPLLVKFRK